MNSLYANSVDKVPEITIAHDHLKRNIDYLSGSFEHLAKRLECVCRCQEPEDPKNCAEQAFSTSVGIAIDQQAKRIQTVSNGIESIIQRLEAGVISPQVPVSPTMSLRRM